MKRGGETPIKAPILEDLIWEIPPHATPVVEEEEEEKRDQEITSSAKNRPGGSIPFSSSCALGGGVDLNQTHFKQRGGEG